jgi:hypothetical protein
MPQDFRPDPIADYVEWADNRLNPGYFLGGRIPPYLRKASLGRRARRLAGMALAIEALVYMAAGAALLVEAPDGPSGLELLLFAAFSALLACAAVQMWRSPTRSRHRRIAHR